MKRVVLIICILILCSCNSSLNNNEIVDPTLNENIGDSIIEYQDDNPVKISLYVDNTSGGLDKVDGEFKDKWRTKRDIVVFGSVFCEDDEIASDYFQNIWKNNAQKYDNYEMYKTGWHVRFSLLNGTEFDQMIFTPSDVDDFYDYLELYLYDSANQPIGTWYSHLTDNQMTENTVMTSLKLTAGSKWEEIDGEITVTVFTYNDEEDFDENGKYRGNSMSTVKVYNV